VFASGLLSGFKKPYFYGRGGGEGRERREGKEKRGEKREKGGVREEEVCFAVCG